MRRSPRPARADWVIPCLATKRSGRSARGVTPRRSAARDKAIAQFWTILYGGSVKSGNAGELFAMPDVDGGLIGGASLVADDFVAICRAAQDAKETVKA